MNKSINQSINHTLNIFCGSDFFYLRLYGFYSVHLSRRMAEPIGIASGLLALATFAFKSSVSLYQAVESFQNNQRIIRELKEELEALNGVLQSLQEAAANNCADLKGLNLPLFRCGKACKDLEAVIVKCTAHSGGSRTSFRDWAKLKYMGDDIVGFKNMLAGYKLTISIALGDANLYDS